MRWTTETESQPRHPAIKHTCLDLTCKAVLHAGKQWITRSHPLTPPTYRNAITGSSGQVNVVRVCRHATISPGDVGSHILTDAVDALASTVRPCKTASKTVTRGRMSVYSHNDLEVGLNSHYSRL